MFKKARPPDASLQPVLQCSLCNKTQEHVRQLIAGPSVFICGECVQVCNEIIADEARFSRARDGIAAVADVKDGAEPHQIPDVPLSGPAVRCALCRLPTPVEHGVLIPNRGVLCPGCIGEIEATVTERKQSKS
jgi:ferredoxin